MLWRTSFSSGSSALKTLTFPVFSSVEPPPEPPPPPLLSSPLSALHAPATRTSTAVNAISDQRRIAPLLSFLRLFHPLVPLRSNPHHGPRGRDGGSASTVRVRPFPRMTSPNHRALAFG